MTSNDIVLFYGVGDEHGYMSNFAKYPIIIDGVRFSCNEQYIMWSKAKLFSQDNWAVYIMSLDKPSMMKSAGRAVKNFDEKKWSDAVERIADNCNLAKFTQHPELQKKLLATGDSLLAEAAMDDPIWGIGVGKAKGKDPKNWRGKNILGNSLMRVREVLRTIPVLAKE